MKLRYLIFVSLFIVIIGLGWCWLHKNVGGSEKDIIDLWYKGVGGLIVIVSAFIGLITFWENKNLAKAKWLNELHEKFFVGEQYASMRVLLDYKTPQTDYDALKTSFSDKANYSNHLLQEKLVSYLNFFEFIAALKKRGQLELSDINMTFGYYISRLSDDENSWIKNALVVNEFKNLPSLIADIKNLK
jgi:hypothetical protein